MYDTWIEDVSENVILKIKNIVEVWEAIGVTNEKFVARSDSVRQHVYDLLDAMLNEERQHKIELELNIKNLNKEIESLCAELHTPVNLKSENSLVKTENALMSTKRDLMLIKKDRLERLDKLIAMEQELCERLYEYPSQFDKNVVPSECELEQLSNHIRSLEILQADRKKLFLSKRCRIIDIYTLLDKPILKSVTIETIFNDNLADYVPLSKDFFAECDTLINKLLDELEYNKVECNKLRNRYYVLFNSLYSNGNEAVYSPYAFKESDDFRCKTLEMLRSDVLLLEQCRLDKIGDFIANNQSQIREKMNTNLLSHFLEKEPYQSLLNSRETSEELLNKLEEALANMVEIEAQVSPIVKEVQNWMSANDKINELKVKLKDPIVLKNRGGILLKVGNEKKALEKDIPKYESRIAQLLSSFRSDVIDSDDLRLDDMKILDYLFYRSGHCDADKENDHKSNAKAALANQSAQKSATSLKKAPLTKNNNSSRSNEMESSIRKLGPMKNSNESAPVSEVFQSKPSYTITKMAAAISTPSQLPVKVVNVKEPGFRIPKLTKIPQKKAAISPIVTVLKTKAMALNKRFSRSCSNLNDVAPLKKNFAGSNSNLYKDFCRDLERGIHTSSFIEYAPNVRRQ